MTLENPKDPSIVAFVERIGAALPPAGWEVVDYWDVDLCAIGIAAPSDPHRLVYVSTHQQTSGVYVYECEASSPGHVTRSGDAVSFDELVAVIRDHLALDSNPDTD